MEEVLFDLIKMEKLFNKDVLIRLTVNDLMIRGESRESALLIAYNSYVLNDFTMEKLYNSL